MAKLRNKRLVEPTKSRPRHSNDNGLVEATNGAVIRKHIGYGHIGSAHAEAFQRFYRDHFHPYLNFHRPCGPAEIVELANGTRKHIYPWYATLWEALRRLPGVAGSRKQDVPMEELNRQAQAPSDTEAATAMQRAQGELFAQIYRRRTA